MDNLVSYITVNSEVCFGKPCIKGTRNDYPMLQDSHIRAALSFAADRESFIKIIPTYANLTFA